MFFYVIPRKTFYAVLLFPLLAQPFIPSAKPDKEREGLLGAVRSVRIEIAKFAKESGKWVEQQRQLMDVTSYDAKGNRVERTTSRGPEGSVVYKERWNHNYNAQGKVIETSFLSADGSESVKETYAYDVKGRLIETVRLQPDGLVRFRETYDYDSNGHLIEKDSYARDGELSVKNIYTYDADGRVIQEASCDQNGSSLKKLIYTYDSKSYKTGVLLYKDDGSIVERHHYEYDTRGNLSEVAFYNPDGLLKNKRLYSYEYDSVGNWTQKTEFNDSRSQPEDVIYRTITYYASSVN